LYSETYQLEGEVYEAPGHSWACYGPGNTDHVPRTPATMSSISIFDLHTGYSYGVDEFNI
jgi:hypothetical protein